MTCHTIKITDAYPGTLANGTPALLAVAKDGRLFQHFSTDFDDDNHVWQIAAKVAERGQITALYWIEIEPEMLQAA